jgi:transposase
MKSRKMAVRYLVQLSAADYKKCEEILRGGYCWVWRAKRAQLLLQMDQGLNSREAGERVGISRDAARRVAKRYIAKKDLEYALSDNERIGGKPLLDEKKGSTIIAMVCGPPPTGMARWSIRLIAQEAVKRGIVERVSKETIRVLLGSHELKPWREKNVGDPGSDARVHQPDGRGSGSLPEAA